MSLIVVRVCESSYTEFLTMSVRVEDVHIGRSSCRINCYCSCCPCVTLLKLDPPEKLDFSKSQEWSDWKKRFERLRCTTKLNAEGEVLQINARGAPGDKCPYLDHG